MLDCRLCGACCSFSKWWPSLKGTAAADLERIPEAFIAPDGTRMRCEGDRCSALTGMVGVRVACAVYETRPNACRVFKAGGPACRMVREEFGIDRPSPDLRQRERASHA